MTLRAAEPATALPGDGPGEPEPEPEPCTACVRVRNVPPATEGTALSFFMIQAMGSWRSPLTRMHSRNQGSERSNATSVRQSNAVAHTTRNEGELNQMPGNGAEWNCIDWRSFPADSPIFCCSIPGHRIWPSMLISQADVTASTCSTEGSHSTTSCRSPHGTSLRIYGGQSDPHNHMCTPEQSI